MKSSNFEEIKFNSHLSHNPNYYILEGHINKDTFITYCVEINTGCKSMEIYTGENYLSFLDEGLI